MDNSIIESAYFIYMSCCLLRWRRLQAEGVGPPPGLRPTDLRQQANVRPLSAPLSSLPPNFSFTNNQRNYRSFEGGVTTIQSHPLLENVFAVGRCALPSPPRVPSQGSPPPPLTLSEPFPTATTNPFASSTNVPPSPPSTHTPPAGASGASNGTRPAPNASSPPPCTEGFPSSISRASPEKEVAGERGKWGPRRRRCFRGTRVWRTGLIGVGGGRRRGTWSRAARFTTTWCMCGRWGCKEGGRESRIAGDASETRCDKEGVHWCGVLYFSQMT